MFIREWVFWPRSRNNLRGKLTKEKMETTLLYSGYMANLRVPYLLIGVLLYVLQSV